MYKRQEQTIRLAVYAVGVSCLCVRASTPSLADRQMPYRFFYAYQITRLGRSSKNSFNLKGKSNRANVDAGRLKSRKCNMNVLLLAFDKEVETVCFII